MENSEIIIIKLYNIYKYIEPDFLRFKRLPCFNNIKDLKDGVNRINSFIAKEVEEKGFIDTFKKIVSKSDIYNAFDVFGVMRRVTGYEFNDEDVIALAENKEYQSYYDAYIKQYSITCANDLDENDINNELLKRVLMARLNILSKDNQKQENKKNLTSHIPKIKQEENKLVSNKKTESKVKRNPYNTSIYEIINADANLVDKSIAKLPKYEQELIQRRERIGQGYIIKLLTSEEETMFKKIVDNIKFELEQNEKLYRKVDKNMKKKTFYELVKGSKEKVDKIIETLSEGEKYLIEIRENGEILSPKERDQFRLIVSKVKTRLGTRRDQLAKAKLTKTIEKKKTKGKPSTSIYNLIDNSSGRLYNMIMSELSKEEKDIVMKREYYIARREEQYKLTQEEQKKFNYIVQKLKRKMNETTKKKISRNKKITNEELKEELTISDEVKDFNENLKAFNEKAKDIIHESELQKEEPVKEVKEQQKQEDESNSIFTNNYKELLSIAMKDPRITREVDIIDLSITCLRYGIGKSEKPRDINIIAKCYEITPDMVEEISTRVLEKLYNILVDGIIENNHQQYIKIANKTN